MRPLNDDDPTPIRPLVTVVVIATCVMIYAWQTAGSTYEFSRIEGQKGTQLLVVLPVGLYMRTRHLAAAWVLLSWFGFQRQQ